MILHFLNYALAERRAPDQMIDNNVRVDYAKLRHLMFLGRKLNGNFSIVNQLVERAVTTSEIFESFPMEAMRERQNFVSLLYYFGLLAFRGQVDGVPALAVPNETVRTLVHGYVRGAYADVGALKSDTFELGERLNRLAYHGEWEPVLELLAKNLAESSSIRDYIQGEVFVKAFLLSYLNLSDLFVTHSEPELSKGFADIVLEPFLLKYPGAKYGCVVEVKYLKRGAADDARLASAMADAKAQLLRYAADPRLAKRFAKSEPILLAVAFHGWEIAKYERVALP